MESREGCFLRDSDVGIDTGTAMDPTGTLEHLSEGGCEGLTELRCGEKDGRRTWWRMSIQVSQVTEPSLSTQGGGADDDAECCH